MPNAVFIKTRRKYWSKDEDEIVLEMRALGCKLKEIAEQLGRTKHSIQYRAILLDRPEMVRKKR